MKRRNITISWYWIQALDKSGSYFYKQQIVRDTDFYQIDPMQESYSAANIFCVNTFLQDDGDSTHTFLKVWTFNYCINIDVSKDLWKLETLKSTIMWHKRKSRKNL